MEVVTDIYGRSYYIYNGYIYSSERIRNNITYLKCRRRGTCAGRGKFCNNVMQVTVAHNHAENYSEVRKLKFLVKCKYDCSVREDMPHKVFLDNTVEDPEGASEVQNYYSIREQLSIARNRFFPKLPISLDDAANVIANPILAILSVHYLPLHSRQELLKKLQNSTDLTNPEDTHVVYFNRAFNEDGDTNKDVVSETKYTTKKRKCKTKPKQPKKKPRFPDLFAIIDSDIKEDMNQSEQSGNEELEGKDAYETETINMHQNGQLGNQKLEGEEAYETETINMRKNEQVGNVVLQREEASMNMQKNKQIGTIILDVEEACETESIKSLPSGANGDQAIYTEEAKRTPTELLQSVVLNSNIESKSFFDNNAPSNPTTTSEHKSNSGTLNINKNVDQTNVTPLMVRGSVLDQPQITNLSNVQNFSNNPTNITSNMGNIDSQKTQQGAWLLTQHEIFQPVGSETLIITQQPVTDLPFLTGQQMYQPQSQPPHASGQRMLMPTLNGQLHNPLLGSINNQGNISQNQHVNYQPRFPGSIHNQNAESIVSPIQQLRMENQTFKRTEMNIQTTSLAFNQMTSQIADSKKLQTNAAAMYQYSTQNVEPANRAIYPQFLQLSQNHNFENTYRSTIPSLMQNQHFANPQMQNHHLPMQNLQLLTQNQQLTMGTQPILTQNQQIPTQNQQIPTQNQQLTMRNLQMPTQNQQLTMRNLQISTQNQQIPTQNEQMTMRNLQMPSQNQQIPTQNQQLTMRNLQTSTGNQQMPMQNQQLTMRNLLMPTQQQLIMRNHQMPMQNHQLSAQNQQLTMQNQHISPNNHQILQQNKLDFQTSIQALPTPNVGNVNSSSQPNSNIEYQRSSIISNNKLKKIVEKNNPAVAGNSRNTLQAITASVSGNNGSTSYTNRISPELLPDENSNDSVIINNAPGEGDTISITSKSNSGASTEEQSFSVDSLRVAENELSTSDENLEVEKGGAQNNVKIKEEFIDYSFEKTEVQNDCAITNIDQNKVEIKEEAINCEEKEDQINVFKNMVKVDIDNGYQDEEVQIPITDDSTNDVVKIKEEVIDSGYKKFPSSRNVIKQECENGRDENEEISEDFSDCVEYPTMKECALFGEYISKHLQQLPVDVALEVQAGIQEVVVRARLEYIRRHPSKAPTLVKEEILTEEKEEDIQEKNTQMNNSTNSVVCHDDTSNRNSARKRKMSFNLESAPAKRSKPNNPPQQKQRSQSTFKNQHNHSKHSECDVFAEHISAQLDKLPEHISIKLQTDIYTLIKDCVNEDSRNRIRLNCKLKSNAEFETTMFDVNI